MADAVYAEIEYEQQFDVEPMSLVEQMHNMDATDFYGLLAEAATEQDIPFGDLKMLWMGMADEVANYPTDLSEGLKVRAGVHCLAVIRKMEEMLQ